MITNMVVILQQGGGGLFLALFPTRPGAFQRRSLLFVVAAFLGSRKQRRNKSGYGATLQNREDLRHQEVVGFIRKVHLCVIPNKFINEDLETIN